MSEADRAAAEWEPMTQNHDPWHIAFARECYAAGYEAGAIELAELRESAQAEIDGFRERAEQAERRLERMQAARSELRDAHIHFAFMTLAGKSADHAENGRKGRSPRIELNAAIRAMVHAGMDAEPQNEGGAP